MKVEPTGVVFLGECEIQSPSCTAIAAAPITAVWTDPARKQVNVCRHCLEWMIRSGEWQAPHARIAREFDAAVEDDQNQPQLVVEVRTRSQIHGGSLDRAAARLRGNLLVHAALPRRPYFLLAVVPRPFFLWTPGAGPDDNPERQPDYEFDPHGLNLDDEAEDSYLEATKRIADWLWQVARGELPQSVETQWLYDSGLYESVRDGQVLEHVRL